MSAKGIAHDIVSDVLRVKQELGRFPSRIDYQKHGKFPGTAIIETFGSWALMLRATGLEYSAKGKRNKQELRKRAHLHLIEEVERERARVIPPRISHRIMVISDRHKPYHHPDAVPFLIAVKNKFKPDLVIDIGDGEDFHAMSFHDHDPDLLSPGYELEAVIRANEPMYREFPEVKVMHSNHGSMVFRKGLHHGIPRRALKDYRDVLCAPAGWEWHDEFIAHMPTGQRCLFHHSFGANVLLASQKRGMSLVQGHHHSRFSIQYWATASGVFFAVQTGCLVDDTSLAMVYNKTTAERPILGCVVIIDGTPRLVPMFVDRRGRWNGILR